LNDYFKHTQKILTSLKVVSWNLKSWSPEYSTIWNTHNCQVTHSFFVCFSLDAIPQLTDLSAIIVPLTWAIAFAVFSLWHFSSFQKKILHITFQE
jgi:hypothetical protein